MNGTRLTDPRRASLEPATGDDVPAIVTLRNAVAGDLTARYGKGHWSSPVSERGVLYLMRISMVCVAREDGRVIATARIGTRKPWAIDASYFSECRKPLYLCDMAVDPGRQHRGIGRACVEELERIARSWPGDAIRLDAYDSPAGAGEFYRKCGFTEVGRVSYRNVPLVYFERRL